MSARRQDHTCHADGCDTRVPPRMLMCRRHWAMVPRALQRAVWDTYQPGQERLDGSAYPSCDYLDAARAAVDAVAAKEAQHALPGLS